MIHSHAPCPHDNNRIIFPNFSFSMINDVCPNFFVEKQQPNLPLSHTISPSDISCWCVENSWNKHFLLMRWESMKTFKATSFLLRLMLMLGIVRRVFARIFISFRYWYCWFVCSSWIWDAVAGKRGLCCLAGRPLMWKMRSAGYDCWTTRLTADWIWSMAPGLQRLLPAIG